MAFSGTHDTQAVSFTAERYARALERCFGEIAQLTNGCVVACSGGLDSTVLLQAMAGWCAGSGQALRALHVDHGLHSESARWSEHCVAVARSLGIECTVLRVDARAAAGESPEAAARTARYHALALALRPAELLLTAHHADDQAETLLLQMLRGGGARAMAGMAAVQAFACGWQARPLLGFRRAELERWARAQGLAWIEDPSNRDHRHDRNYLRHAVLPAIQARWPAASMTLGRVARHAQETLAIAAAGTRADLQVARRGTALALAALDALPEPRRRAVVRAWLSALGLPLPSEAQLIALLLDAGRARADRVPCTDWPGASVHRYRGYLHASASSPAAHCDAFDWDGVGVLPWPHGGRLELQSVDGPGLSAADLPRPLRVQTRRGGEEFAAGAHLRPLRKWMQEQGVLPWRRDVLPVLSTDGRILAVADLGIARPFAAAPGEPALRLVWHERPVVTEGDAFGYTALPS